MNQGQGHCLQALQRHWHDQASRNLTSIDWQGQSIEASQILEQVARAREQLQQLLSSASLPTVGINVEDGPENLILGLALALEGTPQAILPIQASATEQRQLSKRFSISHRFCRIEPEDKEHWRLISSIQGVPFWQCIKQTKAPSSNADEAEASTITSSRPLLIGTTSGTTNQRPGLVTFHCEALLELAQSRRWSPYQLIRKPLVTPAMQNWSSRCNKLRQLLQGQAFVVRDSEQAFADQPLPDDCDGTLMPPNSLRRRLTRGDLKHCRQDFLIISGADRVPMDLRQDVQNSTPVQLGITYATSQTGPITWLPPEHLLDEVDSVGWPLPDVSVELLITQNNLTKNGLNFHEAWISTPRCNLNPGDLLSISNSGQVIYGGRANDAFVFNSILISPFEIEDAIRQHPGVNECAAFGAHSDHFGGVPMAAVTHKEGWTPEQITKELEALCREKLGINRPRKLIIVKELPRGSSGKILRRELSNTHALQQ
jgi:acyl-coenzyme A synthetase/AMP-(fatty) acid ligase